LNQKIKPIYCQILKTFECVFFRQGQLLRRIRRHGHRPERSPAAARPRRPRIPVQLSRRERGRRAASTDLRPDRRQP
jgi:hypothetical protein